MLEINQHISIPDEDIRLEFISASGPGGQNVNKVASAVQLRFNTHTPHISEDIRQRLIRLAGKRINEHGELIIEAKRFRTQDQNRADAINRLAALIRQAAQPPKIRLKTRVPPQVKQQRLEAKRHISDRKRLRRRVDYPDD